MKQNRYLLIRFFDAMHSFWTDTKVHFVYWMTDLQKKSFWLNLTQGLHIQHTEITASENFCYIKNVLLYLTSSLSYRPLGLVAAIIDILVFNLQTKPA